MKKRTSLLTNTALHVSEAFTQTGPGYHEGTNGVSVKPSLPISPADYPRACQEFLVTFVSQTKVTRPSACDSKRGETAFDFKNHGGQPKQPISPISLRSKRGETAFDFKNHGGQPKQAILR